VRPEDRIEASDEDAAAFCVNAVNVGHHIVMARAPLPLKGRLEELGYTVTDVDLSPFILAGGGAYCMTLRLDRQSGMRASLRAAE
jgi:N-dimethylarginine dimethylaminohydrolase